MNTVLDEGRFFFGQDKDGSAHEAGPKPAGLDEALARISAEIAEGLPGPSPADHVRAAATVGPEGVVITLVGRTEEGRRALLRYAGAPPPPEASKGTP